jgi:hypothetical protein
MVILLEWAGQVAEGLAGMVATIPVLLVAAEAVRSLFLLLFLLPITVLLAAEAAVAEADKLLMGPLKVPTAVLAAVAVAAVRQVVQIALAGQGGLAPPAFPIPVIPVIPVQLAVLELAVR